MIKLRSLLEEGQTYPITKESIKTYWNFALNALRGANPDSFYKLHRTEIEAVAALLTSKYGPTGGTVYRGIMLDPSEVRNGKINQLPHITYVSFSEDKDIALAFADTENPMAEFMMQKYPNHKGYLITSTYQPSDVLFHHKWITDANMWSVIHHFFGENAKYFEMQKEVMLKPKPYYRVEPVQPGVSNKRQVGTE